MKRIQIALAVFAGMMISASVTAQEVKPVKVEPAKKNEVQARKHLPKKKAVKTVSKVAEPKQIERKENE